jgi:hypothetical protein
VASASGVDFCLAMIPGTLPMQKSECRMQN